MTAAAPEQQREWWAKQTQQLDDALPPFVRVGVPAHPGIEQWTLERFEEWLDSNPLLGPGEREELLALVKRRVTLWPIEGMEPSPVAVIAIEPKESA